MTTDSTHKGLKAPPRISPRTRVLLLTAVVLGTSVRVSTAVPGFYELTGAHVPAMVALTAAFALSERLIFHVEARNEAVSYSPTDIALAIGILFVSPVALVLARMMGAATGMLVWRRPPLCKLAFNLAHFAMETVLAVLLFRLLFGETPDASVLSCLGLLGVLFAVLIVGGLVVATASTQFEGGLGQRLLKELANATVFHLPGAVVAASIAVPMLLEPWLGIISLSPVPVVWSVVRTHGALLHRYTDLTSVHEFSREVGNEAEPSDIASKAVIQIAENLRASTVSLRIWDAHGIPIDVHQGRPIPSEFFPASDVDPRWISILEESHPHRIGMEASGSEDPLSKQLHEIGIEDALVVPLMDDRGVLGLVLLGDRQGATAAFDDDDINRLSAMAQQLAVAIRKGQFHSQIQHEATHDRLTGLPNRVYFEVWVDQALGVRGDQRGAVLLVDLDRFKEINDTFGHHTGDEVLVAVSDRILQCCDERDLAARFGGDDFAVFVPGSNEDDATALAQTISASLEEPFELGIATVAIASSIGIALCPSHGQDASRLLRRADIAMYYAKRRHIRSNMFRDDLEENDSVRVALLADLRAALEAEELRVHYQPKLDAKTGAIVAAEALVRWTHPERGPINPEDFVGLAEQAGLTEELTRQVLGQALRAASEWKRRGRDITVAVNVSAQSLLDEQLEVLVSDQLREVGMDPSRLTLEITEGTMMGDPARTRRILRGLNNLGVKLSVDDFGTGFSSLVNLRHLPVSELKIDRSFVSEMMSENNDEVIVRSTIDLGHNLGLQVVAEGVEDDSIQRRLGEMGCDILQGYGISRPLPPDQFVPWVQEHRDAAAAGTVEELIVPQDLAAPSTPTA